MTSQTTEKFLKSSLKWPLGLQTVNVEIVEMVEITITGEEKYYLKIDL